MSEPERTAPESFLLLKFGANVYTRDGKEDSFRFDDASADAWGFRPNQSLAAKFYS